MYIYIISTKYILYKYIYINIISVCKYYSLKTRHSFILNMKWWYVKFIRFSAQGSWPLTLSIGMTFLLPTMARMKYLPKSQWKSQVAWSVYHKQMFFSNLRVFQTFFSQIGKTNMQNMQIVKAMWRNEWRRTGTSRIPAHAFLLRPMNPLFKTCILVINGEWIGKRNS